MAAGGLSYEIALTRLLSALLISSWVAPVLAVALLGVGLGAALAALSPGLRSLPAARTAAGAAAVLAVLSLPVWLWAAGSGRPLLGLLLPLLAYLGSGLSSAAILSWWPRRAAWLLRADYGFAALAAVATPWLLGQFGLGAIGAAVVAAALISLVGSVLSGSRAAVTSISLAATPPATNTSGGGQGGNLALAATSAGLAAVALAFLAMAVGSLRVDPGRDMGAKPISQALSGRSGVVEMTSWDATARTDLVRLPNGARYLYMDGGAGSLIPTPDPNDWSSDVGAFAFAMAPAKSAFLIGTGGGLDVAQARANGVDRIVAVEVNPASIYLVRELGATTGFVYQNPTEVVVGDGRRVLAGSAETYDVITLANVVTGAAELRGAALTENRVYTVEAFVEYLGHLNPDGRLVLKLYDELTLTRALTTALAALIEGGYADNEVDAAGHLMAVLQVSSGGTVPVLAVKRSPFSGEQAVAAARVAERRGWALLLVPGLLTPPALQPLVTGEAGLQELIASSADVDVAPTHDNAPYFFSFEPGVPADVRRAGVLAAAALALLVIFALLTSSRRSRRIRYVGEGNAAAGMATDTAAAASSFRRLLASALLGAAFLLVELNALPLIQGSAGHPAWSLSLTLGAVLLGSAVGAQLTARAANRVAARSATEPRSTDPRLPSLVAGLAVITWSQLAPPLAGAMAVLPPPASGLILAVTLFIAAIPMGMPFPRILASFVRSADVAAALAFSGIAAVAAGAGALWLSHTLGSPAVGWAAAAAYLVAALVAGNRPGTPGPLERA